MADGEGVDHELRDGIAIGQEHQNEHQHVPESEAVQRRRHALWRMHGQRIERTRDRAGSALRCSTARLRTNNSADASSTKPPTKDTITSGPQLAMIGSA